MTIWQWGAPQTARRIRSGEVSCVEVTRSHLDRLDVVHGDLNAVVVPLHEQALALAQAQAQALAQARALDARRARGEDLPPLAGVPVTVKINVDLPGQANSDGVAAWHDAIATAPAPVVANLLDDGAVVLGLTNTPEISIRWFTGNPLHGATRNPWSAAHTPGGSSGGAASAVAAGIGCVAHGNDMGGSVRYPAHCCGVAGLRPSSGRVANGNPSAPDGRPPISQPLSVQGPLARSVADLRLALARMARYRPQDADWHPAPSSGRRRAPDGVLRVAMAIEPFGDGVHPAVADAVTRAAEALRAAGHRVKGVTLPDATEGAALWGRLAMAEVTALFQTDLDRHGSPALRRTVAAYRAHFGSADLGRVMRDLQARHRIRRAWSLLLDTWDLVLMPVSAEPPLPDNLDDREPAAIAALRQAQRAACLVNLLGLCPRWPCPPGCTRACRWACNWSAPPWTTSWPCRAPRRCSAAAARSRRACGCRPPAADAAPPSFPPGRRPAAPIPTRP